MEEKPVKREQCIRSLKALLAAKKHFFEPHKHFLAGVALAVIVGFSIPAIAQMGGDAPYPSAANASGQMQQDDQVLVHDRAVIAHDREANPSRVSDDEAQYKADMAAYHHDSDETADHMNGQQVQTETTTRTFVPLE